MPDLHRCHFVALALSLFAVAPRAQVAGTPTSPQMRYVDFHDRLDQPGVVVAVGRLGKGKEGKRERLENGQLGGGSAVTVISGTQFFKVPVRAPVQPQAVFGAQDGDGATKKPARLELEFDVQVARLPDGSEQRQAMTGTGARLDEDTLALFVVAPAPKGSRRKGLELLHVVAFDAKVDQGPDAEAKFVDAMHDFYVVNRRVADLEHALAAVDAAAEGDAEQAKAARAKLQDLVDHRPELRVLANDPLLDQHAGPLEMRAKKRLEEAAAKEKADAGAGKD